MIEDINFYRRRFLGAAAITLAATQVPTIAAVETTFSEKNSRPLASPAGTSFGPIRQIDAGLLNFGYAEAGPANGRPVLLLHGWPYDPVSDPSLPLCRELEPSLPLYRELGIGLPCSIELATIT